jgi:hypothetical protein
MGPLVALAVAVAAFLAPATGGVSEIETATSAAPVAAPVVTVSADEVDAWETYKAVLPKAPRISKGPEYDLVANYMGSGPKSATVPAGSFEIESVTHSGTFHIFRYVPAWHA